MERWVPDCGRAHRVVELEHQGSARVLIAGGRVRHLPLGQGQRAVGLVGELDGLGQGQITLGGHNPRLDNQFHLAARGDVLGAFHQIGPGQMGGGGLIGRGRGRGDLGRPSACRRR